MDTRLNAGLSAGDLVQLVEGGRIMTVISCGFKSLQSDAMDGVLCTWSEKNLDYEWVYEESALTLVRKERRMMPRWPKMLTPSL